MGYVTIELTGTSSLVTHNARLADPDDEIVREIKALTNKRTKTEDDRRAIERLEWFGGLYLDPSIPGPVMPTACLRRMLIRGGTITKQGTAVSRALNFSDVAVPIVYDGPRDIEQLWEDPSHRYRASVKVGQARTMRMRPIWPRWSIVAEAYLTEEIMDPSDLVRVVEQSGRSEGLCDNRLNGYGRFLGKVTPK